MIKNIIKFILPVALRAKIRLLQKKIVYAYRQRLLSLTVMLSRDVKIILGAAMTRQNGWFSTNEEWLDITNAEHWERMFKGKKILTSVVSEHVFEHLTPDETRVALNNIYQHLVDGGRVRIAVPDGYNPNPEYIRNIDIGGIGADAEDHKQLLNCDSLMVFFKEAGFEAFLMEGYQKDGSLICQEIDKEFGHIVRSRSNKALMNNRSGWDFIDSNTSLIVDGIKKQ